MTKYSLESRKDDYEPEEGEIQDDDDDDPMGEIPSKTVGTTTFNKGTDRETCSKTFLLCRRDDSKSCSRKSNCNTYGGKPYYTPGAPDDAFVSNHNSRARYRTSPAHKWYHTHRQNTSSSKEWGISKSSMGSKERERRETKRTRNQYYPSFVHPPSDQRSTPSITSSNSCLNSSIPPWHWYSKHVKDKNKKTSVSPSKITATMNHCSSKNQNQTNNSCFSLNSVLNVEQNTVAQNTEKKLERNYSLPGSPASTNSVEIIEVPPKIPEVITIYDSDEEPCKDPIENSSNNAAILPKENSVTRESQNNSPEIPEESSKVKDILQGNCKYNNNQEHLTVQRNDGIEMQEFNSQQNNNLQEINLTTERSVSSLARIDSGENNLVNQTNKECTSVITDSQDNTNESLFGKIIPQAELVENNVNIGESDYWRRNSEKDACFDTQTEMSAPQPTLNMNISESSHQGIQFPHLDSNIPLSSCSLSSPKHSAGYMIEGEYSSDSRAQMYPADSQMLDSSKTNENFADLTRDEPAVQHSIYSPTVFQADEIVTPHSDIHSSQNSKCLCQKHISITGYKSNAYIPPSLRINRNINYSVLKLIVPTNEKTNLFNHHNIIDNEITDKHACEKGENNSSCRTDKEENSSILNTCASHENDQEKESPDISEKVTSVPMNNDIQTECSPNSRNQIDNTKQNATFESGSNADSDVDISRNKNITDSLTHEHTILSKNTENVENSVSVNDSEKEEHLQNECTSLESVETLQASSVAALKRRANELQKLHHSSVKKNQNQKSVPGVVMNKKLRETAFSLPSHHPSNVSFHENDVKNSLTSVKQVNIGSFSGYTINSFGEKCLTYTSPLVYEDRIGTIMERENGPFSDQATSRMNVTVPELIINLGRESDSGDDSDDKSCRSKSADDSTHEMKAEHTNVSISKTINTDFEKKLEVLLKEARYQQESNIKFDKGDIVTREELATSSVNKQSNIFTPVYTTFLHKSIQPSSAIQGCARAIPRSTIKKMASSKAGKLKTANHRIKSVVIKSFPGTVNKDRTIPNDRTIKTSTTINSYKQANKGWNRNVANKGKVSRQTSSMGDIGLLPPLKQKEYMKLKRQLVQMTQKKRDIRNRERCESVDFADRSTSKQEEPRQKQTIGKTTNARNNSQEVTITFENESNPLSKTVQATDQKRLQTTSRNKPSEIQINIGNHMSSENCSCHNHEKDVSVIGKEQTSLPPHNSISKPNVSEVIPGSELIAMSTNLQEPSLNDNQDTVLPHQSELLPTSLQRQTSNTNSHNNKTDTKDHNGESVLSDKRKHTIRTQEQVQKKQKTGNKEIGIPISDLHDTNIKENISENPSQCQLVENLWSSETKLIASRRQVLEDIATVRLQLHKIEAANFRKDLLIKNINRLKDELKQSEDKLKQEEDCVKNLNNMIDNSRLLIQRGQSELLSLTLECEELGCKVHGAPNYNVPKTCADLIRNEMLAMTQAMQDLENPKYAM